MAECPYPDAFQIASLEVPYISLFHSFRKGHAEYQDDQLYIHISNEAFELGPEFAGNKLPAYLQARLEAGEEIDAERKCRFIKYSARQDPGRRSRLEVTLSRIRYSEFLRSGKYLDEELPGEPGVTFRSRFAANVPRGHSFGDSLLTNICGVGVFLITADRKVIVSKHSDTVNVSAGMYGYSASGSMDWNCVEDPYPETLPPDRAWSEYMNPFNQVARESYEEIAVKLSRESLYLIGLGIDAQELYFQFSFIASTPQQSQRILREARTARDYAAEFESLEALDLEPEAIVDHLTSHHWEPAAKAALLCICAREFGLDRLEQAIDAEFVQQQWAAMMRHQWNDRAEREGVLSVMSSRYPKHQLKGASEAYLASVCDFIGSDIDGRDVVEFGPGIGRLTQRLVGRVRRLTCVEFCKKMLRRMRTALGEELSGVEMVWDFGQNYRPSMKHDVAICSLVLIHNVDDGPFLELTRAIGQSADVVFLFEHVGEPSQPHQFTRIRTEADIRNAFPSFVCERRVEYPLFNDRIVFLKMVHERSLVDEATDRERVDEAVETDSSLTQRRPIDPPRSIDPDPPTALLVESRIRVFVSYAHEDEPFKNEIIKQLARLTKERKVEVFHDRNITAGDDWKGRLDQHMDEADIFLLLVSPDFINSEYCYDIEMKRALERHQRGTARVIPIIIRSVDWQGSPISDLQVLPTGGLAVTKWNDRDECLSEIAIEIRRIVENWG